MTLFNFLQPKSKPVNIRKIDDKFSVTGQITPEQVKDVSAAGFKAIICARPDNEEGGQPSFDAVARAAEAEGERDDLPRATYEVQACRPDRWRRDGSTSSRGEGAEVGRDQQFPLQSLRLTVSL